MRKQRSRTYGLATTVPIIGSRRLEHAEDCLAAVAEKLESGERRRLDAITAADLPRRERPPQRAGNGVVEIQAIENDVGVEYPAGGGVRHDGEGWGRAG